MPPDPAKSSMEFSRSAEDRCATRRGGISTTKDFSSVIKNHISPKLTYTNVSNTASDASATKIRDVKSGMREMTIMARVTARAPVDLRSQTTAHALATIADDTGEILLNLWRNQISQVQVGDSIILRNAFARKHMGRLEVSTWADIEKPQKSSKPMLR
jgi:ssDNA-binding replication factor A large subunit